MPSFDIISQLNLQEVDNAINQARKEIESRYDFRGSKCEIQWDKKEIIIIGDDDYKMGAIKDILQTKMHRRGIDIRALKFEEPELAGGRLIRQKVKLVQGLEKEVAKDIIKIIKETKLKVQPQMMDEKVRVTSKSIDELQETMSIIKNSTFQCLSSSTTCVLKVEKPFGVC